MLSKVTKSNLKEILGWRNDPEVRKVMFNDHQITENEHLDWFKKIDTDNSKEVLIFTMNDVNLGVVNFFDIDENNKSCHWGFYLSNNVSKKINKLEVWQELEKEAIEYSFKDLKCEKLICESYAFNLPVIEMHKRFGFLEIGTITKLKDSKEHKVVITELTTNRYNDLIKEQSHNNYFVESFNNKSDFCRLSTEVVFLSSSNIDFLSAEFVRISKQYSVNASITKIPFGNYIIEANDPKSELRNKKIDYIFFVETLDDMIIFNSVLSESQIEKITETWNIYLENIKLLRSKINGTIFVGSPINIQSWIISNNLSASESTKFSIFIQSLEEKLLNLCQDSENTYVLDLNEVMKRVGRKNANPGKYKYLARAPFSIDFNKSLSSYILGLILSLEGKTAKVLALDLDNTIWGGVIGDDGLDGIQLGGDYPGNVFKSLQSLFVVLKQRGFSLVVVSKNTENIAFDAINNHPEMILSAKDFAAYRINWLPKLGNIKDIANELGVDIDSVCFVDDNPIERAEVRYSSPEIFIPELPDEISEWKELLMGLPELTVFNLTDEDRSRADSYKLRSTINNKITNSNERESYLSTLSMSIEIEPYSEINKYRALQLINKTNQFTTTTSRYNETTIEEELVNSECFSIRLIDNSGSNEIIGVFILKCDQKISIISSFLLSCRVLGREIETAVLFWICEYLKRKKIELVHGMIYKTSRNIPVQDLYIKHGFKKINDSKFELNLDNDIIKKPSWIKIKGGF